MAEGGLFYAAMFTVVAGLGLIFGLGIVSFFNPYRGNCISQFNVHTPIWRLSLQYKSAMSIRRLIMGSLILDLGTMGPSLMGPLLHLGAVHKSRDMV